MNVEDVKKVCVLGAETMGSGIAQVVSLNSTDVVLLDVSDSALNRGMKTKSRNCMNGAVMVDISGKAGG